jgi:hypothetical protein
VYDHLPATAHALGFANSARHLRIRVTLRADIHILIGLGDLCILATKGALPLAYSKSAARSLIELNFNQS